MTQLRRLHPWAPASQRRLVAAVVCAWCLQWPVACSPEHGTAEVGPPSTKTHLHVGFEIDVAASNAAALGEDSSSELRVSSLVVGPGRLIRIAGRDRGQALRFPTLDELRQGGRAVVVIVDGRATDRLAPRTADFRFGADINLDTESEIPAADNGDNVMQRGLYVDAAQYKLQVDHGVPSCRIAGAEGSVFVEGTAIPRNSWQRVTCSRTGSTITLEVTDLSVGTTSSWASSGTTGDLAFDRESPLAVGGKVKNTTTPVRNNSDQFNGALDNVFFEADSLPNLG